MCLFEPKYQIWEALEVLKTVKKKYMVQTINQL